MRNTIVATVLAVFLLTECVGCKLAPKMPWSKTAATASAESSVLAHSAPALPADIAKQAEALASTTPAVALTAAPTSGGEAAPYSLAPPYSPTPAMANVAAAPSPALGSGAKTIAPAYPTTGDPPYMAAPAASHVATTPSTLAAFQSTDKSADLDSVAMPYDPNNVPPAQAIASSATPTTPTVSGDRYAGSSLASAAPAYRSASIGTVAQVAVPQPGGGGRYGNVQTATSTPIQNSPSPYSPTMPTASAETLASAGTSAPSATSAAPAYVAPATMGVVAPATMGDRYAAINPAIDNRVTSTIPTVPSILQAAPVNSVPVVIANAIVYRPGGTTSYAGLSAGLPAAEIASRPMSTDGQVPNASAPGSAPEPAQAPRYR